MAIDLWVQEKVPAAERRLVFCVTVLFIHSPGCLRVAAIPGVTRRRRPIPDPIPIVWPPDTGTTGPGQSRRRPLRCASPARVSTAKGIRRRFAFQHHSVDGVLICFVLLRLRI